MAGAEPENAMFSDEHFQALAAQDGKLQDFLKAVGANAPGYTEKKRLLDGLKDFVTKVEAAENKLYMVKAVGKVKGKMESEDHELISKYFTGDLKEKIQAMSAEVQVMIDDGRLTVEERPVLQEQLAARRTAAKEAGKAKQVEKLELMLVSVGKSKGITHPVKNLEDFYPLDQELKRLERLAKAPEKNLSDHDKDMVKRTPSLQEDVRRLERKSRMWFETSEEFHRRLQKALIELEKIKAEEARRAAQEAAEQKLREEEEALERKRQALREAEERRELELEAKLERKRQEAALKPTKAAPQAKKKEKVQRTKLDPHEFFQPPPRTEEEPETQASTEEAAQESQSDHGDTPSTPPSEQPAPPPATPEPKPKPKAKAAAPKAAPKVVIENKWGNADDEPIVACVAEGLEGPSLQEAVQVAVSEAGGAKKGPAPQPKKKEKKKFAKMSVAELGFDANNPNYR